MLEKQFALIKEYVKDCNKKNIKISKATVGWHLDHSLKVMNSVLGALKKSDPTFYKSKFNLLRLTAFTLGAFPRGKAKSPKRVLPPAIIIIEDVKNQLEIAIDNFKSFQDLEENQYFEHPLFKHLNKKKALKFLEIHTNHHLKIVKDILK